MSDESRPQLKHSADHPEDVFDVTCQECISGDHSIPMEVVMANLARELAEFLEWQRRAYLAHPNLDRDIERVLE